MISKKFLIAFVLLGIVTFALVGCTQNESEQSGENGDVDPVKIGVLLPLTGGLASIGEQMKNGNELATEKINESGGIKSLNGAPLELIFLDGEGQQEVAMGETERAIESENVSMMTGSYHSASAMAATQMAERLKTPYLIQVAGADSITDRGFEFVSRVSVNLYQYGYTGIEFLDWLNKENGADIKKIALINEDGDFGQSTATGSKQAIEDLGFDLEIELSYPSTSTQDMTPYVSKLIAADVDAVVATSFLTDAILLGETSDEMNLDAIKVGLTGGFVDPNFAENIGEKVDDWFLIDNFNYDIPGVEKVSKKYEESFDAQMSGHAAHAYQSVNVIANALERAASRDKDEINKAIKETDIGGEDQLILPYEKIKFDETGQNTYANPVVIQYNDGIRNSVYPSEYGNVEPNF